MHLLHASLMQKAFHGSKFTQLPNRMPNRVLRMFVCACIPVQISVRLQHVWLQILLLVQCTNTQVFDCTIMDPLRGMQLIMLTNTTNSKTYTPIYVCMCKQLERNLNQNYALANAVNRPSICRIVFFSWPTLYWYSMRKHAPQSWKIFLFHCHSRRCRRAPHRSAFLL